MSKEFIELIEQPELPASKNLITSPIYEEASEEEIEKTMDIGWFELDGEGRYDFLEGFKALKSKFIILRKIK